MFQNVKRKNFSCDYAKDDGLTACSNQSTGKYKVNTWVKNCSQDIEGVCQRQMCWETYVGIEFYKLTVFDFLIQLAVVTFFDIPRYLIINSSSYFQVIDFEESNCLASKASKHSQKLSSIFPSMCWTSFTG